MITAADYLKCSSFEPDAEFVDDHVEARAAGERDHNDIQKKLILMLCSVECEDYFDCVPEQRVRTTSLRFRIPDLCLLRADAPVEQVVVTPPLLCIEVLSPEDTMVRMLVRVDDFLGMGVPEVWVFDPVERLVYVCGNGRLTEQREGSLAVSETPIRVSIAEVFSILDKKRRTV